MLYIIIFGFVILCFVSVCFRVIITHPGKSFRYAITDFIKWVRYKQWNECKTGQLIAYCGLFGKGKTLSAVHHIVTKYKRYNNQKV